MAFGGVFGGGFRPAFDAGGARGNGLLNALIAYWPLNEASGCALDAHSDGYTLTDYQTVTSGTGLVYAAARQFTAANKEHFARTADDAGLSVGDVDFTLAAWVNFDTVGTVSKWIASKRKTSSLDGGYQIEYLGSDIGGPNQIAFAVFNSGTATVQYASTFGTPTAGVWYLVVSWHDAANNTLNIQVNNGTVDVQSYSGGVTDDTDYFDIGALRFSNVNPLYPMNGRIGPVMFWKSAAGGGGVLSEAQRTALYNSGAGLAYTALTA